MFAEPCFHICFELSSLLLGDSLRIKPVSVVQVDDLPQRLNDYVRLPRDLQAIHPFAQRFVRTTWDADFGEVMLNQIELRIESNRFGFLLLVFLVLSLCSALLSEEPPRKPEHYDPSDPHRDLCQRPSLGVIPPAEESVLDPLQN